MFDVPQTLRLRSAATAAVRMLPAVALVAVVALMWVMFVKSPDDHRTPDPTPPKEAQDFRTLPVIGQTNAHVGILEFSEFQCPFCGAFARTTLKTLEHQYVDSGRVAIGFRHFPLAIHQFALGSALGAACADRQSAFVKYHDGLFAMQDQIDENAPASLARHLGFDMSAFGECVSKQAGGAVAGDIRLGQSLGVVSTPTFFIGRVADGRLTVTDVIVGAKPLAEFVASIDRLLRNDGQ
jgi:protein-disulfide isomerase